MKRKRLIGVGVAAIILLLTAVYMWGPGSAPRGQDPVVTLSEGNLEEFEKAFDVETDVPAVSVAAVADLTDLSAGGLRSSATVNAAQRPKAAGVRRVGTDPPNGLATAKWQHARTDPGRPSASVLGPEVCRVRSIEGSRNPNSSSAEAGLLRSERVLLGRSDFVSGRHALERCSSFFVLEWSGGSHRSRP